MFHSEFESGGEVTGTFSVKNVLGDINGNGVVEVVDATLIQKEQAEIHTEYADRAYALGDFDGDGISIIDVTTLLRWKAEMPVPYPINEMTDII